MFPVSVDTLLPWIDDTDIAPTFPVSVDTLLPWIVNTERAPMFPVRVDTLLPWIVNTERAPIFPVMEDILLLRNDETVTLLKDTFGPSTNEPPTIVVAAKVPGIVKFPLELSQ